MKQAFSIKVNCGHLSMYFISFTADKTDCFGLLILLVWKCFHLNVRCERNYSSNIVVCHMFRENLSTVFGNCWVRAVPRKILFLDKQGSSLPSSYNGIRPQKKIKINHTTLYKYSGDMKFQIMIKGLNHLSYEKRMRELWLQTGELGLFKLRTVNRQKYFLSDDWFIPSKVQNNYF